MIQNNKLPKNAATELNQVTSNTLLTNLDTKTPNLGQALANQSTPVVLPQAQITTLTPPPAITGFNLEATQNAINSKIPTGITVTANRLLTDNSGVTQPISVSTLPLPTGASTSALQTTSNTLLTNINNNLTNGTQKAILRSGDKGSTTAQDVTSTNIDTDTQALDINIKGGSTLNDGLANPTVPNFGAFGMVWNSATSLWDRMTKGMQTIANSLSVSLANNDTPTPRTPSTPAANINVLTGNFGDWVDISNYRSASFQVIGGAAITAGALVFQCSNDGVNASTMGVEEIGVGSPTPLLGATNIGANTVRTFACNFPTIRYIRINASTAFAGGTVQIVPIYSQLPYNRTIQTIHQGTSANLNTQALLAVGANLAGDVGVQYRPTNTGASSVLSVMSPATPTVTSIKASAGKLIGWQLQNSSASIRSVKIWNNNAPTLGTNSALFEIDIPANSSIDFELSGGIGFGTGITYAVTSAKGLTDNTAIGLSLNDVSGSFFFA